MLLLDGTGMKPVMPEMAGVLTHIDLAPSFSSTAHFSCFFWRLPCAMFESRNALVDRLRVEQLPSADGQSRNATAIA
jgi:hypothetical protein